MSSIKHATRKELTADQILAHIEDGGRVVIELSVLGKTTNVVIRQHSDLFYCDTPMKLMKFDSPDDLRNCLERFQLARRETDDGIEFTGTSA